MKPARMPEVDIPPEVAELFGSYIAAEYCYFTSDGEPLCWPVTPYWYPDRGILGVATGLAYPGKADRAKGNPRVALLFSDPSSSGLSDPPEVLVQGDATVLDENLQENTDRYVRELRDKFPAARVGLNPLTVKFLGFYLPRLWIEISPRRILISSAGGQTVLGKLPRDGQLDQKPRSEMPMKSALGSDDSKALTRIVESFDSAVLAVGRDGYPLAKRVKPEMADDRLRLADDITPGLACLTFHRHMFGGTRFEAYMVRGRVTQEKGESTFVPKKLLSFFGNGWVFPFSVLPNISRLRSRLRLELQRRGQPMPKLRIP
jgi:hypothetical protein